MRATKEEIRTRLISQRISLEKDTVELAGNTITRAFIEAKLLTDIRNILCYIATGNEVETKLLIDNLKSLDKNVYVPAFDYDRKVYVFARFNGWGNLVLGPYGVKQPADSGEIERYNGVKNLNFDIIIWQYFINDIQPKDASTGSPIIIKNSRRAKILEFVSKYSYLLDYMYWRYSTVYDKTVLALRNADITQYTDQERLQKHQKEITDFIASLRSDNKKIIVVMFPSIAFLGADYPTFTNDIMHKIFSDNQVETIDLWEDLKDQDPKKLRASRFDTHPNETVHALAAQKLYEKTTRLLNIKELSVYE